MLSAALMLCTSCGSSPTTPSTTAPQSTATLTSGAYLMTLSMATSGNSGFSSCVSLTAGGTSPAFASVFASTPVVLDRSGNAITITPQDQAATFRMQLQVAGANLSGTAAGDYQTGATKMSVTGTSGGSAIATGIVGQAGPYVASGALTGTVSIDGLSCTNNGHTWTLMPR